MVYDKIIHYMLYFVVYHKCDPLQREVFVATKQILFEFKTI